MLHIPWEAHSTPGEALSSPNPSVVLCWIKDIRLVLNCFSFVISMEVLNPVVLVLEMRAKSIQSCLTLSDPMYCSPLGSSVHAILQARILEWVAIPSSRGSSQTRDRTLISYVSCIGWQVFTASNTCEAWHSKSSLKGLKSLGMLLCICYSWSKSVYFK